MPSKKEVELFKIYSRYASNWFVFGLDRHPTTGKLIPTKSKFKLMAHYLFLFWILFLCTFNLHRNYVSKQISSTGPMEAGLKMTYIFITIAYVVVVSWLACFAAFRVELANLWGELILICSASM